MLRQEHEQKNKIPSLDENSGRYFLNSWHNIKDVWTQFSRKTRVNFANQTNNRMEWCNQKFKTEVKKNGSLDAVINSTVFVIETLKAEICHSLFHGTMRCVASPQIPELQKSITLHAYAHVLKVQSLSNNLNGLVDNAVLVEDSSVDYSVRDGKCSCCLLW